MSKGNEGATSEATINNNSKNAKYTMLDIVVGGEKDEIIKAKGIPELIIYDDLIKNEEKIVGKDPIIIELVPDKDIEQDLR